MTDIYLHHMNNIKKKHNAILLNLRKRIRDMQEQKISRRGDLLSRRGDLSSRRGDLSSRRGDLLSRRGD